ncbi:MAG: hypothetical protein R3A52_13765 [Polyangiales bacterium]
MTRLRFTIFAVSLSLTAACVRDVDLARDDVPDGGPREDVHALGDAPTFDVPTADAPPTDAPPTDAPSIPYCPEDLDRNTAQNPALLYPRAVVMVPPDSAQTFPTGPSYSVSGLWVAPRRLATPVDRMCPASVASAPGCHPDAVIRVQPIGATEPVEFLVSVPFDELPVIAVGTVVTLSLEPATIIGSPIFTPESVALRLVLGTEGPLQMFVMTRWNEQSASRHPEMSRAEVPVCVSRPEPTCNRTLAAYEMRVTGAGADLRVPPLEDRVWDTADGRFRVRNYGWIHRIPGYRGGFECADYTYDSVSYEMVRLPSP